MKGKIIRMDRSTRNPKSFYVCRDCGFVGVKSKAYNNSLVSLGIYGLRVHRNKNCSIETIIGTIREGQKNTKLKSEKEIRNWLKAARKLKRDKYLMGKIHAIEWVLGEE